MAVDVLVALLALNVLAIGGAVIYSLTQGARSRPPSATRYPWQRVVGVGLLVVVALLFLWQVRDLLTPFAVAFFLATLLDPVVTNLQRRGISRGRAVASLFGLAVAVLVLGAVVIVPRAHDQMEAFAENAQSYYHELTLKADDLYDRFHPMLTRLHLEVEKPSHYLDPNRSGVADAARKVLESVTPALMSIVSKAVWLIILPLSLVFFLLDYQAIRAKLISFFPERSQPNVDRMSQEIVNIFSLYFRNLAKVCLLYGATAAMLFYWLGLRHALFIGIAAGIFYAVPYAGPALTTITAGIIALTMNPVQISPTSIVLPPVIYALVVIGCYGMMHVTFDYIITPRLVGGSVGLHPLVNVFALTCGASLFGVLGMLLAVPVAASIQMMLVYFFPKLGEKPRPPKDSDPPPPTPPRDEAVVAPSVREHALLVEG